MKNTTIKTTIPPNIKTATEEFKTLTQPVEFTIFSSDNAILVYTFFPPDSILFLTTRIEQMLSPFYNIGFKLKNLHIDLEKSCTLLYMSNEKSKTVSHE